MSRPGQGDWGPVLRHMALRNFRLFRDTGEVELAPITAIFGKNSSGKTTLVRAPFLFRQLLTGQSPVGEVPLSGEDVDFGSYRDLVFQGDLRRDVGLSFGFDLRRVRERWFPRKMFEELGPLASILETPHVDISLHWNKRAAKVQVAQIRLTSGQTEGEVSITRLGPQTSRIEIPSLGFKQTVRDMAELGLRTLPFQFQHAARSKKQRRAREVPEFFFYVLVDGLTGASRKLVHVGPLRQMPERAYRLDQITVSGPSTNMVAIMAAQRRAVAAAAKALRKLGVAQGIEVTHPAPGYVGIVLTPPRKRRKVNLADTGFGISQVLPILVTLADAEAGSLVIIEQPELHLHPETQGRLADLLVEMARERRLSLVLESHSEHILLRLQRRLASGRLAPRNIAIYFVDEGKVSRSSVDSLGRIDPQALPDGFFEEEWTEAVELAKAAIRRS